MAELLLGAAFGAAYFGFACLALSLPRHWREVMGEAPPAPRGEAALRPVGYFALASAFALAVARDGASFGSVSWVLLLAAGAVSVAFTLSWRPHWLAVVARAFR